jgi:hypothetical protein
VIGGLYAVVSPANQTQEHLFISQLFEDFNVSRSHLEMHLSVNRALVRISMTEYNVLNKHRSWSIYSKSN